MDPSAPNPLVQLDPGLFIWTIITFLVLFFVLAKFAWKPLLKMLQDREDMIRSSLDDAEKA
ncbi:MAG: ATP synthase F0 subunit B, partial [Candidatus Marinimicrobia bacterium]|nr:ATP synthase F0 subunit B [Candidatus Neomarinimicrobiota bacterium]